MRVLYILLLGDYIGYTSGSDKMSLPKWLFNENIQIGIDYTDSEKIQEYDNNMQKLRNIKKENEEILSVINISNDHIVIDFGTGTGEFALKASKYCQKVIAVDASKEMLKFAEMKAKRNNINNIEFYNDGFLTFEYKNADSIVTQLALHHLPDFWKMIALKRMANMLKPKGKLFIRDVVYSFDTDNYIQFFDDWVEKIKNTVGADSEEEAVVTVRNEYVTLDWIMEELLKRAGFNINKAEYYDGFIATYICTK